MDLTEEYLDSVNELFPYLILKYYENINTCLTLPIENDKREYVVFQNIDLLENNYNNNNIIQLNKEDVYVVLSNIYNHHFYHTLQEFIVDLEIYLLFFKKYKIICFDYDYNSDYFKLAREYFSILDENILVINRDNRNIYNGNFLYLHLYPKYKDNYNLIINNIPHLFNKYKFIQSRKYLKCYNNLSYKDSKWINKDERIIINKFIEEAYKKYGNDKTIQLYDRIWISRRNLNIHTYKHKRFIKNINDIVPILEKNNFTELFFEDDLYDIFKQIYIINNASIIFTEMGTAFCNINFMKPNTKFITTNYHEIPCLAEIVNNICDYNNVNFYIYNDIETDTENEYYLLAKECVICPNLPIKITDINNFNLWFDNTINNNN